MAIPVTSSGQLFSSTLRSLSSAILVLETECNPESNINPLPKNPNKNPLSLNSFDKFSSRAHLVSDEQKKISEKPKFRNEKMMMRTIPPRLPKTPPPPSTEIKVRPRNGSSSGGTKWTLRTEARDGSNRNSMMVKVEGVIEIPKTQSVASLREQIAKKLEVKMPSTPPTITISNSHTKSPLWISGSNEQYPYVPQHDDTSNFQHLATKMSKLNSNSQSSSNTTLQKQLSIVHEPVERHISCITPVSFNRTATLSSSVIVSPNMLDIYSNNTFVAPVSSSSGVFSSSPIIHKHEENNGCSPSLYNDTTAVYNQLSDYQKLMPVKQRVDNRSQPFVPSTTANATISSRTLSPPSFFVNSHNKYRNKMVIKDLEIPVSTNHTDIISTNNLRSDIIPTSNHRTDIAQGVESQFDASSSSKIPTSTPPCQMLSQSYDSKGTSNPSVLRCQQRKLSTPASTVQRINRSWTPNLQLDNQKNSLRNYELQSRRSKSVGRYVESQSGMEQPYQRSSENLNRELEEWKPRWRHELDRSEVNDQSTGDVAKIKKLAKYEVLLRQKVEKLSEELQQQQSRRHGYVPSAAPALQKNFDRFSGLINEFGRPERAATPQTMSKTEITTCTALHSFRAVSPKELSFNRGDVIRVYRIIDINWMEGELNGQSGIFPSSYVQIDSNEESEQFRLVVLYPFSARNKNELSLKKGEMLRHLRNIDANWIEGKNIHGQTGIFPKSYVRKAREISLCDSNEISIPDRPKTPHTNATPFRDENPAIAIRTDPVDEMGEWQKRHNQNDFSGPVNIIPKNVEIYRVLYAYKPKNADELELQENDIVFVIEKCDDGWFIGTLPRTGQFGTFPGNYVERH
ncbi:Uncharacterized protein BM_BM6571 [Brugia malayi]|uniref:SH3 domain-containing protein n=1 Tax=Brugia malayi TaxID=6279 RepID=A0A4E9ET51_BRUMA|nr:Uncharacterized protein BM_BM6571 [Brugia malayi]VIO87402.1 Uncharacterized protein BM_BM6571 [Brugia malayi]